MSDSDVESYKQIKADLDGLRLLVEKSELWVYKAKMTPGSGHGDADQVMTNEKKTQKTLVGQLCVLLERRVCGTQLPRRSMDGARVASFVERNPVDMEMTRFFQSGFYRWRPDRQREGCQRRRRQRRRR